MHKILNYDNGYENYSHIHYSLLFIYYLCNIKFTLIYESVQTVDLSGGVLEVDRTERFIMPTIKEAVKLLTNSIIENAARQDDPNNRIVRSIRVDSSDFLVDKVYITSDCDGFAEEEKLILTTYEKGKYSDELFASTSYLLYNYGVGSTEAEIISDIKTPKFNELCHILNRYFADPKNEVIEDAAELECCAMLITSYGECNWNNILKLRNAGFDVYAGDKDSFGWLTGVVEKDGIKLIYG